MPVPSGNFVRVAGVRGRRETRVSSAAGLLDPLALLARWHGARPVRRPAAATAKVNRRRKGEGRCDSCSLVRGEDEERVV